MPDLRPLYDAESLEDLRERYDAWAARYDADAAALGRLLPPVVAGVTGKAAPAGTSGPVMDAGCGTGVMGRVLAAVGYGPVDGLDLSPGMLAVAREKPVYRHLHEAALGPDRLPIADGQYGVVVAAGVFTLGHAGPEGLDELVRITRTNGVLVFSAATPVLDDAFLARIQHLADAEQWRLLEATDPFPAALASPDAPHARVFAYQRM